MSDLLSTLIVSPDKLTAEQRAAIVHLVAASRAASELIVRQLQGHAYPSHDECDGVLDALTEALAPFEERNRACL
jgi:hypothetical protein